MNLKSRIDKHRQFTFHCFQTDKHSNRVTQRRRCVVIKEQQLLKKSSRKKTHNCETRKQCRRHRRRETLNFIFFVEKSWAGWKLCCERESGLYINRRTMESSYSSHRCFHCNWKEQSAGMRSSPGCCCWPFDLSSAGANPYFCCIFWNAIDWKSSSDICEISFDLQLSSCFPDVCIKIIATNF